MEFKLDELIRNAVIKSDEALNAAEENYLNKHYETCLNRLYYSIFYIVSALAYKDGFVTSKHSQLLGWFNKKYIYTDKIFNEKMFVIYKEAFENRQKSDYDFMYKPNTDDIFLLIKETKDFLAEVKKIL